MLLNRMFEDLPNLDLNNYLRSVSSLTRSINASYAFNDRLIEYMVTGE